MRKIISIIFLISGFLSSYSQSIETKLYVKEELIKQRDDLLRQVRNIQSRIDAIAIELGSKSATNNKTKYLTKAVRYDSGVRRSNSFENKATKQRSQYESNTKNYRTYHRGPRGGCYYINSKGNKTYVARSMCN